jgi:peptidoglycan/LPS O-acetylase OafA/YrhL
MKVVKRLPEQNIKYLDGVRGLALILVFLSHAGWFQYGYVGVWLFFTLSGYLISGILLRHRDSSNYYSAFYARRMLRIAPLYSLTIIIAFAFYKTFPEANCSAVANFLSYALYLQNFVAFFFSTCTHSFLRYTWSLAVEELFYLILPASIKVFATASILEKLSFFIMLIGPLVRQIVLVAFPDLQNGTASVTLLGLEVFSYGTWLAARHYMNKSITETTTILGLVAASFTIFLAFVYPLIFNVPPFWKVAYSAAQAGAIATQPIFHLMPPLCGFFLALAFNSKILQKVLSFPLLVWTGNLSYALYLFHGLLFQAPFIVIIPASFRPFAWIALSYILAIISRYCIEQPILSFKKFFSFTPTITHLEEQKELVNSTK